MPPKLADLALAPRADPLALLVEHTRAYAPEGRAIATRRAYLTDFASFEA
jgi:hypothetical protein